MSEALQALAGRCQHEQDIKKSRFLALAAPVDTPEEALAFVQEVSDAAATHNCWAYRIGQAYRFNDDGEPGGTAGRPILQAIEGQGIDHAVVVVTRWYGGIKLGAGGLARAYGGTAAECLRLAERVSIVPMATLALSCDFADLALLKARLPELEAILHSETFHAEGADLVVRLPQARVDEALIRITDLTRGRSLVRRAD
ncbi:IMPACT family protein [Dyella sp. KULCS107]|uniref:IMPACT family protein n=1 Tax=Dyella sp. KULCS107 TaxID=3422216 RepID=UPI003D6F59F3